MRALRAHGLIGRPSSWVDEIPVPARPAEDAVRIDVHAAGVGFVDTPATRGKYQVRQDPPFVPGMEVAGVVADAPDGCAAGSPSRSHGANDSPMAVQGAAEDQPP
jgi:NADPH2:quinone reductase